MSTYAGVIVGLYLRMSIDRSGKREGVAAQERWGRTYAAEHWPGAAIRVFVDNNLSSARGDLRPGFEELRLAVRAGEIDQLWTVEQSRLDSRSEAVWFELAAELDAAGISEIHTNRDGIVRVRDDVAGIKAVISAGERRRMVRRVNDKLGENAALGLPAGSRYFAFERTVLPDGTKTLRQVPERAEALRWAADAVLSGWSLTNIAAELRRRGHVGPHGGRLMTSAVHRMLTSPSVAGLRAHQGEIKGRGNWEPILSESVWQAVRARLAAPRSVRTAHGATYDIPAERIGTRPARKYIITGGLSRCGVCGAAMGGAAKTMRRGVRRPYLSCARSAGGRGCVGIMLDAVEDYVRDQLFAELDKPEFLAVLAADDHAERRDQLAAALSAIDAQRDELAVLWGAGSMKTTEWQAARAGLDQREQTLRAELAAVPVAPATLDGLGDLREDWPEMTLDERREVLRLFIDRVVIRPATPSGRPGLDQDRVDIQWRGPDNPGQETERDHA